MEAKNAFKIILPQRYAASRSECGNKKKLTIDINNRAIEEQIKQV